MDINNSLKLNYPPELPICEHRAEILALLKAHQVVIVCGDTGSGKTTQLPKMAMELGRGANGRRIACTQPRRIAAVTVAERVARELKTETGGIVGYQHRYARKTSAETRVKFMTDGVLLAETRSDPLLKAYDTIIIDEAHERTLNVDFLLGILKRILERRRDLKVVVSSATLDTERFSQFFDGAPALAVPGRLYPVETVYMPPPEDEERDLPRDVAAALATLPPRDDTLVFLPGERDIRETADHLARSPLTRNDDIIPLLASLPAGEIARAFHPDPARARRRVILATNVAETSLTIPGIRAVVDSGLARIPRYIHRTQVQRLQIEPVSQASARQRAGRCGRVGPGTCIRLYSEEDFESREKYTPPEILRSSLAGVILTMLDLRLGLIEDFPFIDPPKPAMVREGLRELLELGAIHRETRPGAPALTETGRRLAKIPLEPRLARMAIAASGLATLPSVIPVVAAMGCDDPRRRPADERDKADQAHAQFKVEGSDFLGTLKLWRWWDSHASAHSQSQLRKLAQKTYLSYPKMREWRDLVRQLTELAKRIALDTESDNGGTDAFHRALMSGLIGRIGRLDPQELDYRGAHGTRFEIHPGSVLAKGRAKKHKPEWIVAGELVDTSRLFARNAAAIDPRWIESIAGHVCKHSWHSPEWDAANGFVRATERVTLYGLVIVEGRRRDFSRIDPETSRKLFILHALVLSEFPHPPPAVRENAMLIAEIRKRAERARQPGIFDMDRLAARFEETVPKGIVSAGELKKWLHGASREELAAFRLKRDEWLSAAGASRTDFPETIRIGGAKLALSYRHSPDDPESDGITCTANKSDAPLLRLWRADWLVPGALAEKVAAMLGSLPSAQRRVLSPLQDTLAILLPMLKPGEETLADALRRTLLARFAMRVAADAFDDAKLPPHLKVRFRIRDDDSGKVLAVSRDLETALAGAGAGGAAGGVSALARGEDEKHVEWDFGSLDSQDGRRQSGWNLAHFKALHDEGDGATIRLYKDAATAAAAHKAGVTRLLFLAFTRFSKPTFTTKRLPVGSALYFSTLKYEPERVASDLLFAAIRDAAVEGREEVRTREAFDERLSSCKSAIAAEYADSKARFGAILQAAAECSAKAAAANLADDIRDDIATEAAWLMYPGFARTVPRDRLAMYPRYFKALSVRIDRARTNPTGDRCKMARFEPYWEQYRAYVADKSKIAKCRDRAALAEYRWMLEEYRISLFAQEIKTAAPVSPVRLAALWVKATGP